MAEKKSINLNIQDGIEFFSHEMGINFNPEHFVLDFRSVTPRIDPRAKDGPVMVMRHNPVIVTPYHAKKILELLNESVSKYEKEFGKIDKPAAIKKFEKKHGTQVKVDKPAKSTPSYFG